MPADAPTPAAWFCIQYRSGRQGASIAALGNIQPIIERKLNARRATPSTTSLASGHRLEATGDGLTALDLRQCDRRRQVANLLCDIRVLKISEFFRPSRKRIT